MIEWHVERIHHMAHSDLQPQKINHFCLFWWLATPNHAPGPRLTTMNLCCCRFLCFLHYEEIKAVIPLRSQCEQTSQVLLEARAFNLEAKQAETH